MCHECVVAVVKMTRFHWSPLYELSIIPLILLLMSLTGVVYGIFGNEKILGFMPEILVGEWKLCKLSCEGVDMKNPNL